MGEEIVIEYLVQSIKTKANIFKWKHQPQTGSNKKQPKRAARNEKRETKATRNEHNEKRNLRETESKRNNKRKQREPNNVFTP